MQINDQKLTIKTKERAKQLNELTNELVAASLFDSNLFHCQPNKSLHFRGERCQGGKQSSRKYAFIVRRGNALRNYGGSLRRVREQPIRILGF